MQKRKSFAIMIVLFAVLSLSCSGGGSGVAVDPSFLPYFKDSYGQCRDAFLEEAESLREKHPGTEISNIRIPCSGDNGLFIDTCYVPARKSRDRLLVIIAGLHGVEGFAGSAVTRYVMKELLPKWDLDRMGVLFVHGVNPWGFKNIRRVTESNVDLNRNFASDKSIFSIKNPGYGKVYGLLNPEGKADAGSLSNRFFPVKAVYYIVKYSMKSLREAILKGQYEHDKGIYFGGREMEPQKPIIDDLVVAMAGRYRAVFAMDIHTGYGERNTMHLFPNPVKNKRTRTAMEAIFKGYKVDWGDTGDFYITTGDLLGYLEDTIASKRLFIPMCFEFGTMDSQTTMGSIRSIHNIILENQGFWNGYDSEEDRKEIANRYIESYYPSSPQWRSEVLRQVKESFPVFVERFSETAGAMQASE